MKKSKIIIPALAMLLLSTTASITGTVAWFTANNKVNVGGMNIKAEAENGIVIANETHAADADWLTTITASHSGADATFVPTSTADLATWYHGLSDEVDDGQHNVDYDTFGAMTLTDGVASAKSSKHFTSDAKNVYLLNDFYVQASAKTAITNQDIFIEKIAVTGASASEDLDKSLRVGLKVNDTFKDIYAPLSGATLSYGVNGAASGVSAKDVSGENDTNLVFTGDIPAYDTAGATNIKFSVFVYFEGEDANHKSANIEDTLDSLQLSFVLRNANHQ